MVNAQKVPYKLENFKKCICRRCPVQEESECVKKKTELMSIDPLTEENLPKKEDASRLYCSLDKAVCEDIDTTKMCICGSCPVWEEYNLSEGKPFGYYCRDGMAE